MRILRERKQGYAEILLRLFKSRVKKPAGPRKFFLRTELQKKIPAARAPSMRW